MYSHHIPVPRIAEEKKITYLKDGILDAAMARVLPDVCLDGALIFTRVAANGAAKTPRRCVVDEGRRIRICAGVFSAHRPNFVLDGDVFHRGMRRGGGEGGGGCGGGSGGAGESRKSERCGWLDAG